MTDSPLQVLLEDNHCLAIDKPAGLLSMGDETGDTSAADRVREYLKRKYDKPGNVFIGIVHRLDRPVSGVMLFARTSKAASRLSDQFRRGAVKKTYRALVHGHVDHHSGQLTDWLMKDRDRNHVSVVSRTVAGAKQARLDYEVIDHRDGQSLLELTPITGRSHQIRVQLAHLGHPIVGDMRYGAHESLDGRIALHATRLEFEHPTKHGPVVVCSDAAEFA